jgi:hypothetical protein
MERISPITTGVEGRIRFVNETDFMTCGKTKDTNEGHETAGSKNLSGFATSVLQISSLTALLLLSRIVN